MKLSVIGGGSTFISFFINGLDLIREELQVDELVLMDIDEKRLSIVGNFARRMAKKRNLNTKIELTLDPVNAIKNSDFVITTIRPGGLKARATDERIALKYGLFPHETLGVVGLSYALRVVPPIVNYTRLVEKYAPDAWLIHFTNPASITAQASVKYVPNVKVFSVCDVPLALAAGIAYMLGAHGTVRELARKVFLEYIGLNHAAWIRRIYFEGKDVTKQVLEKYKEFAEEIFGGDADIDAEAIKIFGMIPHPYLDYGFLAQKRYINYLSERGKVRGEEAGEVVKKVLTAYSNPNVNDIPPVIFERGKYRNIQKEKEKEIPKWEVGSYEMAAFTIISAIYNKKNEIAYANIPSKGAIKGMEDDMVFEMPVLASHFGLAPLIHTSIPLSIRGFIHGLKASEILIIEAAMEGSKEKVLQAVLANPLFQTNDKLSMAIKVVDELLKANREYLPQFFK
ncbi:MAG: hypothetical protein Q6351_003280 [Candidatus Njordarchaeum guaymaensis]